MLHYVSTTCTQRHLRHNTHGPSQRVWSWSWSTYSPRHASVPTVGVDSPAWRRTLRRRSSIRLMLCRLLLLLILLRRLLIMLRSAVARLDSASVRLIVCHQLNWTGRSTLGAF